MKKTSSYWIKSIILNGAIASLLITFVLVRTQDIVQSDDIGGSSSVFQLPRKNRAVAVRSFARNIPKRSETQTANARKTKREQVAKVVPQRKKNVVKNPGELIAKIKSPAKPEKGVTAKQTKENNTKIYVSLGDTYLANNDVEQAIQAYQSALAESPTNNEAKLGLSEALVRKGDSFTDQNYLVNAVEKYNEAKALNPKNAGAFVGLGNAYEELEKTDEAIFNYEQAIAVNANLSEIFEPLGTLYLRKGDNKNAENYLTKAYNLPTASALTKQSVGIFRYNQNRIDEAFLALKDLDTAESNFYLGEIYQRKGDKDKALQHYLAAVNKSPNYFDALNELGSLYADKGDITNALVYLDRAVKANNVSAEANENLADAYRLQGQKTTSEAERKRSYQQAESNYGLAILQAERIKGKTGVYDEQILARLYSKMGFIKGRFEKWEEAIAYLEKSKLTNAQIKQTDTEYKPYVDNSNLGWAYYNSAIQDDNLAKNKGAKLTPEERTALQAKARGKLAKAKEILNLALSEKQDDVGTMMNLGTTLNDLGEYQAAVAILERCLTLKPNWLIALNEIGTSFYALNLLDQAANYFKKAIDGNGNFFTAVRNLAATEFRRGNKNEVKRLQDILRKNNQTRLLNDLDNMIKSSLLSNPANKVESKVKSKLPKIPSLPY